MEQVSASDELDRLRHEPRYHCDVPQSADGMELVRAVYSNQVAYVIEDAFTWTRTTEQYLRPALRSWQAQDPAALSLAYETDAPRTRVWRVQQ